MAVCTPKKLLSRWQIQFAYAPGAGLVIHGQWAAKPPTHPAIVLRRREELEPVFHRLSRVTSLPLILVGELHPLPLPDVHHIPERGSVLPCGGRGLGEGSLAADTGVYHLHADEWNNVHHETGLYSALVRAKVTTT